MFEDIITEKDESFVKYDFPNGTIIVDFDKKQVILKDKFTRKEFKDACEAIYNDLGGESPVVPTIDGKWYKLGDGFISCYPNGLTWCFTHKKPYQIKSVADISLFGD